MSYALGAGMLRLFTVKVLGVPHLLHLDRYGPAHGVKTRGLARPDYIGLGAQGWLVAEAKGRSNGVESAVVRKLEWQKSSVVAVEGSTPWMAIGSVAHFASGSLELNAYDPEELDPDIEPVEILVDRAAFYRAYYQPFVTAIDAGVTTDAPEGFVVSSLGAYGQRIGLPTTIEQLSRAGERAKQRDWEEVLPELLTLDTDSPPSSEFMPDGSYFNVDWDEAFAVEDIEETM